MSSLISVPFNADITRDSYDKDKSYRQVMWQLGRPVLDSELNEQQSIYLDFLKTLLEAQGDAFIDGAFEVQESSTNTTNNFLIKMGECHLSGIFGYLGADLEYEDQVYDTSQREYIRKLAWTYDPDTADPGSVPALTTPSGSNRDDLVVLSIIFEEVDSTQDSDLIDPNINRETAIRIKVNTAISVIEDFSGYPSTSGHESYFSYYNNQYCFRIPIAWLRRLDGDGTIVTSMIEDIRERTFDSQTIFDKVDEITQDFQDTMDNHIADDITSSNEVHGIQQGTGNGFDSDKVDGADLSNDISSNSSSEVWSTDKIREYVQNNLSGLDPQAPVDNVQEDGTLDPGTPSNEDRYVILDAATIHTNFGTIDKLFDGSSATIQDNDIVEYRTSFGEFRIIRPTEGFYLRVLSDIGNYANAILLFDGTDWVNFGSTTSHQDLQSVLGADKDDTDSTKNKHVSNEQMNDFKNDISSNRLLALAAI